MADEKKGCSEIVAEIANHIAQITPGPWHWSGNVDYDDPGLCAWGKFGRTSVARMIPVERRADDWRIRDLDDIPEDQRQGVIDGFLVDENGIPRSDLRLAFSAGEKMRPARDLAVYEVCREATERSDPRVYRADIVGLRNPDAEFIAAAPGYVRSLLEIISDLQNNGPVSSS